MSKITSWRISLAALPVTTTVSLTLFVAMLLPARFAYSSVSSGGVVAVPLVLVVIVLMIVGGLSAIVTRGARVQIGYALVGVSLLVVAYGASMITSQGVGLERIGPILPMMVCALFAMAPRDKNVLSVSVMAASVRVAGSVVALETIAYSLLQSRVAMLLGWTSLSPQSSYRGRASFGSSVTVGSFLGVLCLAELVTQGPSQTRGRRVLSILLALLFGAGAILTQSRSALLSTGIVALVIVPLVARGLQGRRRWRAVAGGFFAVSMLLGIGWLMTRQNLIGLYLWSVGSVSDVSRYDAFMFALRRFTERPILGYGIGSIYPLDGLSGFFNTPWGTTLRDPHNGLAMICAESGIVGISAFAAYVVMSLRSVPRYGLGLQDGLESSARRLLLIVAFGMLTYAVTTGVGLLGETRSAIVFWGILWSLRSAGSRALVSDRHGDFSERGCG